MADPEGGSASADSSVPSGAAASASSAAPDVSTLVEKAIAVLPSDLAAQAQDPKRKARSQDPGWKYGWWPDPMKKDFVQCVFCKKIVPAGIKRFKQHLAGGYVNAEKCPKAPELVREEMHAYLKKNTRTVLKLKKNTRTVLKKNTRTVFVQVTKDGEQEQDGYEESEGEQAAEAEPVRVPSSGTKIKQEITKIAQASITSFVAAVPPKLQTQKASKSVSAMLCKTAEEVVAERHKSKTSQPTLEHCTEKDKEAKLFVDDHVADFFYENGIPFNVINSRSWEIMLESIGQYGPGYRSPTYCEIREPFLERAVNRTTELRKKHEEAWKEYGCTLMSDGWTDTSHRHLIRFLANSPAGTFFLGSVDATSEIADAQMLADLLEKQVDKIGKEYVVQVVSNNGINFKAAGRILMERIPHLFWTPCASHCLNLMLQDISEIKDFSTAINEAKKVCRFLYKHGKLLDQMRQKLGADLVRPAVTRFTTSYLTLASMHKHKNGLRNLFVSNEWNANNLSTTIEGKQAENIVLSMPFWTRVENCLRASQPLLIALRIADRDETPAAPEIMAAMDVAKSTIKDALKEKPNLLKEVMVSYEKRWENQMVQQLYGAALFLNPSKFFAIREKDKRQAARLRSMFNDVLWKMVTDEDELTKISNQAYDYERSEGDCFSSPIVISHRDKRSPFLWWGSFCGLAYELQCLAKRITSLCCSTAGCERDWSAFANAHNRKRNRLEYKRLNKLVYVSYNRKISNKFQKIRELGFKGKIRNPLLLEEFDWENEWVDENCEAVHVAHGNELTWSHVHEAIGATKSLRGRNFPRAAASRAAASVSQTYARRRKRPRNTAAAPDIAEEDDSDHDRRDAAQEQQGESDSEAGMEEDEDSSEPATAGDAGGFHLNVDLLI